MRQTLTALLAVVALLSLHGAIDRFERMNDERLAYARWVHQSCFPTNERDQAVSRIERGKLRCSVYADGGYGRAGWNLASTAVMEIPE